MQEDHVTQRQPNTPWRLLRLGAFAALAVPLGACSFSIGESADSAAVDLIEGELGDSLGFGPLEAACVAPDAEEAGETFSCSATTESGDTIDFDGVVESDDEIFVGASNVLTAEDLSALEADAVAQSAANFEVDASTLTVDCPDESLILADDRVICQLTDASDGGVYELRVDFGDFVLKEGRTSWEYTLGDRLN